MSCDVWRLQKRETGMNAKGACGRIPPIGALEARHFVDDIGAKRQPLPLESFGAWGALFARGWRFAFLDVCSRFAGRRRAGFPGKCSTSPLRVLLP